MKNIRKKIRKNRSSKKIDNLSFCSFFPLFSQGNEKKPMYGKFFEINFLYIFFLIVFLSALNPYFLYDFPQ